MSQSSQEPGSRVRFLTSLINSRTASNANRSSANQHAAQDFTHTTPTPNVSSPSAGSVSKYGELQEAGAQRRRWIDDPEEPNCHIRRNTLTLEHLRKVRQMRSQLSAMKEKFENLEIDLQAQMSDLGYPKYLSPGNPPLYRRFAIMCASFNWFGCTGPDMIILEDIERNRECFPPGPHISQISQVLYEQDFPLEELRHVFVRDVMNQNTSDFITSTLYPFGNSDPSILSWPVYQPRSCEHGTPEYDALLGTTLGRMIAYLVLGAFQRGSRRIQRIVIWSNGLAQPHMRFDIVPVS